MDEDDREHHDNDDNEEENEQEQLAMSLVILMMLNHFKTISPDIETWNQIAEMIPNPEPGKSYLVGRLQILHRVVDDDENEQDQREGSQDSEEEGHEGDIGEDEGEDEGETDLVDSETIEFFGDFVLRLEEPNTWKKIVHWYCDAPTSSTHYDMNVLDLTQTRFLSGM